MQAINHIINSAAKSNYTSSGQISVPIAFRGPNGAEALSGANGDDALSGANGADAYRKKL
ncbi:hypothetical protein KSP39_PZI009556 [Platanthera zijinensis]|uniref:Pyruvate dehydrogenase E1 component subunit beta n=1 Tax=Platanthera zijinensis TaxID=2320716 RepID=A0AAP0BLK2_9ASPA